MQGHRADPEKTKLFYHYVAELINMFVLPEGPPPAHSGFPRHASRVLGRAYADLLMERSMNMIHDVVTGKRDVESTFTLFPVRAHARGPVPVIRVRHGDNGRPLER